MSRPASAPRSRPVSAAHRRNGGDTISYEDLLVAQYLEELRKAPPNNKGSSPYVKGLARTHIVPTNNGAQQGGRSRPHSAYPAILRPQSGNKPKIDPQFIADPNLWDPITPRGSSARVGRKKRPISAPTFHKRPLSATYGGYSSYGSRPSSAKSATRRAKPLYRRQPHTIVVTAFKNGSRDVMARIAAPSMKILLEICTDRLGLSNAARRVFLDDGTEVMSAKEIPRDSEIYISMGEQFKDAYRGAKKHSQQQKSIAWTMNGLIWSADARGKSTKPRISKRFESLIEQSRRRVLVFRNGQGTEGVEIVADPERFEDFLMSCTAKLELGTYARVLYDWEGAEIKDLKDAPVLDQCLQTWSTPVLGPLWVSKGEGFSPLGVHDFLTGLITYTNAKLKEARHYKEQLQFSLDDNTRGQVEIVPILSMNEDEIDETLEIVEKDIEDFRNALNRLKKQLQNIAEVKNDEEAEGLKYRQKHIKEFESDHPLVGPKGLRLKVYENGSYEKETTVFFNIHLAARGMRHNHKDIMARLLDQLSSSHVLSRPKNSVALRAVAQKIFDNLGKEITNVFELEYDQEIWLSFGEAWKNPFTFVMTVQFDKVRVFDIEGDRRAAIREQLMLEDAAGQEKYTSWRGVEGVPDTLDVFTIGADSDPMEKDHMMSMVESTGIDPQTSHFLQNKEREDLLLFGEIVVDTKKGKNTKDVWPPDSQNWRITKDGYIHSKAMPQLVLSVLDYQVSTTLGHPTLGPTDTRAQGFMVGLQKRTGALGQQWTFTADGYIYARSQPELFLTYLGSRFGDEDTIVANEAEGAPKGLKPYVAVCEKVDGRDAKSQRWAVKQERMDNVGQWKHTQVQNPEWNKKAYSWPVTEDGEINDNFDWPMEGYFIPYAPPIKKTDKNKSQIAAPIRLMVLKNGVRDISKATAVVGPDLTNMRKDTSKKEKGKQNRHKSKRINDTDSVDLDGVMHCDDDLSVLKLEFILFLERCTSMLDLPFAARRLFDESGKEHYTLRSLTRDQLVHVSCGEPWTDPSLTKAEQQRRYLLSNLASDVSQMKQYMALRNPENLVLEVEGGALYPGCRLVVNECALTGDQEPLRDSLDPEPAQPTMNMMNGGTIHEENKPKSSHEKSHKHSEEWLNRRKWPWQRPGDLNVEVEVEDNQNAFRSTAAPRSPKHSLQLEKFVYKEGYIMCAHNQNLVLGIQETEGRIIEVILVKKSPDDPTQRWIINENGLIQSKGNTSMVLTVSLPTLRAREELGDFADMTYIGCQVVLQNKKLTQFGRANQRWYYDEGTGFINAFHTDAIDKEITAANKANVCTFSVMGGTEIDQPGYEVDMPVGKGPDRKKIIVCSSCARAMRGRYKLERIPGQIDFACAMGNAKDLGIKQIGSFKCLNCKVDLSTHEAHHTLLEWEAQLDALREELSVRAIAKEISAARVPYTVKVLAYKNGSGRLKPGEMIIGSSVAGILEQATHRLGLNQAARRAYIADGTMVMDLDDLVEYTRQQYAEEARDEIRAKRKAERTAARAAANTNSSLISRVELDSEDEEEEEDEEQTQQPGDNKNGQAKGEDGYFAIGYESLDTRTQTDPWEGAVIIPNPGEGIDQDGHIVMWSVYVHRPGNTFLQLFRPSNSGKTTFTIIDQVEFKTEAAGEYTIDMLTIPNPRWQDVGMEVKKGDVIGFYCKEEMNIPYDEDKSSGQGPCLLRSGHGLQAGQTVKMDTLPQKVSRKYSLNAIIKPNKKHAPAQNAEPVSLSTSSKQELKDSGFSYEAANHVLFDVKANNDAYVFLSAKQGDVTSSMYQVIIGGWNNAKSAIRKQIDGKNLKMVESRGVLDRKSAQSFWISWENGVIRLGSGHTVGSGVILECADRSPPAINYVSVATAVSSTGEWTLYPPTGVKSGKKKKVIEVELPPVELVLRYPIEIWVSTGENFVQPGKVERSMEASQKQRGQRAAVSLELEKEKHILRQLQGRRMEEMNPGKYQSTMNPLRPVHIEGHWQDHTLDEQIKHNTVHQLQTHLSAVKAQQSKPKSSKTCNVDTTKRLYAAPKMKRVLMFPNGESVERAVYVWGDTLSQLLDNSTTRLNLRKAAMFIYDMNGHTITDMSEIERDQLLCVSYSKSFIRPKESHQGVEVKANWSRARRQYGANATDVIVQAKKNPVVDVDPFGPSEIAGGRHYKSSEEDW